MVLATCVAAVAASSALGALARFPKLTLDGVGGVRPGMSASQVEARWGLSLKLEYEFGPQCAPAPIRAGGIDGYAVFLDGRFGAVFFRAGAVTGKGIRIGSTLRQVRAAYGSSLTSRLNKYTPGARDYFVRRKRRPHWQLRLDVSPKGRVVQIAFGDDAVRLVEGCA